MFWNGAAWALRMVLMLAHLLFGVQAIIRPNTPLLFPAYSAFDDLMPFTTWGLFSLSAAFLLWAVPTRIPFGLLSTLYSAFWAFAVASTFGLGGGLIFGTVIWHLFGLMAGSLFARALWLYMIRVGWFRRYVLRGGHRAG
jgi:hypothetical protein